MFSGGCVDDPNYEDGVIGDCSAWSGEDDCSSLASDLGFSEDEIKTLVTSCCASCGGDNTRNCKENTK